MKKILALALALVLCLSLFAACGGAKEDDGMTITIGATITPHAEVLNEVVDDLAAEGITLVVKEFSDWSLLNPSTANGELDGNYFQHTPYLDSYNAENGTNLVSVGSIHYEPFGIYSTKIASIDELADGAKVAIPNDVSNGARALLLLEAAGVITLKEGVGVNATVLDIVENPKNVEIIEIDAAQLARSLEDVDIATVNGNYAIQAGLNAAEDALFLEDKDSIAATTYANIIAVDESMKDDPAILALVKALQTEEIRQFMADSYGGGSIAVF